MLWADAVRKEQQNGRELSSTEMFQARKKPLLEMHLTSLQL